MIRIIKIALFLIALSFWVAYINKGIDSYDISFYHGKDGGAFERFKLVVVSSTLFFLLLARRRRVFNLLMGFVIGIVSGIVSYFVAYTNSFDRIQDIFYHIFATALFMAAFFLIEKLTTPKTSETSEINS